MEDASGGYLIALIHSLNNHKTLRYPTRKPRGRRILARGPASVGPARGPKLNTKDSSRKGLSRKERSLPPAPGTAFRFRCKQLFLSARERQGRAQEGGLEGGPHPPVSSSLHPASPGSDRLGEAQEPGRFRPEPPWPPWPARRPPPGSPAAESAISPGHSPLRGPRGPRRERAGATRGGLGAWVSTRAGPPRSATKQRAVLSAPRRWAAAALSAGRAGGRRDAPAQRGAAPCSRTDRRAALPPSRGASGIRHSELSFTVSSCGKADAGSAAAEGARWPAARSRSRRTGRRHVGVGKSGVAPPGAWGKREAKAHT